MRTLGLRLLVNGLAVALLVAGCAVGPASTASDQLMSPRQTLAGSPAEPLHLVALGDSFAASQACECARFPDLYGQLAADALGHPVLVQNRATSGATSFDLVEALDSSPMLRSLIEEADIITVSIGINDWACDESVSERACFERATAGLGTNLEALLSQIDALQRGHPHILRATAYPNFLIATPVPDELEAFHAFYAEQLAALNATICAAVVAHDGLCVELLTAFNGPSGDQDAAPLLVDDHVHPSREGHETIAQEIAASGYAPLAP